MAGVAFIETVAPLAAELTLATTLPPLTELLVVIAFSP